MEIEWTETALADMASLDKGIARASSNPSNASPKPARATSNVSRTSTRPSSAFVSATTASAFTTTAQPSPSSASATAAKLTGNLQQPVRGVVSPHYSAAIGGFFALSVIRGYRTVTCCEIEACAAFDVLTDSLKLCATVTC